MSNQVIVDLGSCVDDCEFDTDCKGRMKCCKMECTQAERGTEGAWRCVTPMFRPHIDPFGPFAKWKVKMLFLLLLFIIWIILVLLYLVKKGNFSGIWYVRLLYLSKNRKYNIFHFSFKETVSPFISISSKLLKHCSLVKALLGYK